MGQSKKTDNKSRRQFFSSLLSAGTESSKSEMIKMLTPDGKLVEVERSVLDQAVTRTKAGNKEIYNWMKNPSKKDK